MKDKKLIKAINALKAEWKAAGGNLDLNPDNFIDSEHLDPLWFGGLLGTITIGNAVVEVRANGDVRATLYKDGEEVEYVRDKGDHGIFAERMSRHISGDAELESISSYGEDLEGPGKHLYVDEANWFEFFIDIDGVPQCDIEPCDDNALEIFNCTSMIDFLESCDFGFKRP